MSDMDLYQILGVTPQADTETIKRVFRMRAHELHPDHNREHAAASAQFRQLYEAYTILSDPDRRRQYDALRADSRKPLSVNRLREIFSFKKIDDGISNIWDTIFGPIPQTYSAGRTMRLKPRRGVDCEQELSIPLRTTLLGGQEELTTNWDGACPNCKGRGSQTPLEGRECPDCRGTGLERDPHAGIALDEPCETCQGRGVCFVNPCMMCKGSGRIRSTRKVMVTIPRGVRDGESIRVLHEGADGINGGPPGDLLVHVHVDPDPSFERDGELIRSIVLLTLQQAIHGCTISVDTLRGMEKLHIPAGVQPGAEIMLEGKGMPLDNGDWGDHAVQVQVKLPHDLDEQQRKAFDHFWRTIRSDQ
ncbi:DnaJ domain-containing protein [Candidatus Sumerlaeota bacterium]|nr:DnaJ domain-containing protein [Candidatus Sumerlaeota bacterium]